MTEGAAFGAAIWRASGIQEIALRDHAGERCVCALRVSMSMHMRGMDVGVGM